MHPSVPAKSVPELIALAKQKPGALTYGTAGVGTALHTAALLLESLAGIKLTAVHYRGAAPALNDLIAGHINMVTMGPSVALPAVQGRQAQHAGLRQPEARARRFPTCRPSPKPCRATTPACRSGCSRCRRRRASCWSKINADVQQVINDPEFHKRFIEPMVVQPMPGSLEAFAAYLQEGLGQMGAR